MLTCPGCNSPMDDAPELAGQVVACPRCGTQFPLPPPVITPASAVPPVQSGYVNSPYGVVPVNPVGQAANKLAASASRNWIDRERLLNDWPYTIKAGMLGVTICWVLLVGLMSVDSLIGFSRSELFGSVDANLVFLTVTWKITTTAPLYGFVMVILGVMLLVAKKPE